MIELVVFDMAGTTVYDGDSVSVCFRAALANVGVLPDRDAVNNVMGLHKPEAIASLLSAAGRSYDETDVAPIHADFVERMLRYYEVDSAVREIPGASRVFDELRGRGIKVALNTGFGRRIVDSILWRLKWTDAVDATIASDEVPRGRPYPDMIRALMGRLEIANAASVAKVGDTPVDLEEGANAGCGLVVGVSSGSFTRSQLAAFSQSHIVDSVAEVPGLLTESSRPRRGD